MRGELKDRMEILTLVFSIATTVIAYFAYEHSKQELWITKNVDLYLKRVEMYDIMMQSLNAKKSSQTAIDRFLGRTCSSTFQETGKPLSYQFSEEIMLKISKDYFGLDVRNRIKDLLEKCQELRIEDNYMDDLLSMLKDEYDNNILNRNEYEEYKYAIMRDGCDFISEGEQDDINKLLDNLRYFKPDDYHSGFREDLDYRTIEARIRELSKEIDDGIEEISNLILLRIPFDQPLDETLLSKIKKFKAEIL